MKTIGEILATIDVKVKEHTDIIREVIEEVNLINSPRASVRASAEQMQARMQEASKMLILKDKMVFHKAAIAVLQDLKESING